MTRATLLESGLWRSPRPTEDELRAWVPRLHTLIDLEPLVYESAEAEIAAELGISERTVPMSSIWLPTIEQVSTAAGMMASLSMRPLCVHCKQGVDRTGIVVAFWRIRYCKWGKVRAMDEMFAKGFHRKRYTWLIPWMGRINRLLDMAPIRSS